MDRNRIIRQLIGPVVGGGGGFLVNRWVACHSGG